MKLALLTRIDRDARRLREILTILAKYGLADWLQGLEYEWLQNLFKSSDGQRLADLTHEARIRMALAELGTTFIKLGQMLSTRADLVGPELAAELERLQADTPPDSALQVHAILEAELKHKAEELFSEFDDTPMASASIGQVHRARLPNGRPVVVKVQHEGVREVVKRDLEIMAGLAELAEKHAPLLRAYQPVALTTQFSRMLMQELDYTREQRNLDLFRENFAKNKTVHFPAAYADLTSRRVLTMELLEGISVADEARLRETDEDLSEFAMRGAHMYLDMIFRDGVYHADPHPGNLMMLPGGVVGVLDCGMIGRLDGQLQEEFEALLFAAVNQDADELTEYIIRIGSIPQNLDRRALRAEIGEFVADYAAQSLQHFDVSGALNGMIDLIHRYQIVLPASCSMLLKVLVMLEGTSRNLDPNFSLADLLRPYYLLIAKRRFSPQSLLARTRRTFRDWQRLLDILPRDLADILNRVRRGSFDVNLQHRNLDSTINRLVVGILAAAMFVGSAELWSRTAPPALFGISIFGAVGYFLSVVLGIRLLIAIKRSGDIRPKK